MEQMPMSPVLFLERNHNNDIYIMREDLLPFSFGGNKARKGQLFFQEIDAGDYDTVVTYGSGSSNHCRVVVNMATARGMHCHIISTDGESTCVNRRLVEMMDATIHACSVDQVARVIERTMEQLRQEGHRPFFIPGGGHGNTGTKAYDMAYDEIYAFSQKTGIDFDYIFLASGTGTTHAGLICGKQRRGNKLQKIVGISIARKNPRGGQVVADSVLAYTGNPPGEDLIFDDSYICGGYGKYDDRIDAVIRRMFTKHGLPLDPTYTGKAYSGMERYFEDHQLCGKKVLFIHTGGTPLFCDWVMR